MIITFLKQMFCKHDFETHEYISPTENFGGILIIGEKMEYKKCRKCGKILNRKYINCE